MQEHAPTIRANIDRLAADAAPLWFIVTEHGEPLHFNVSGGHCYFTQASWAGASLFLSGSAEAVCKAAQSMGRAVEVVLYRDYLIGLLARLEGVTVA
ncbi:MAG: hypothetical protein ACRDDI_13465 [Aeromonas veronii]